MSPRPCLPDSLTLQMSLTPTPRSPSSPKATLFCLTNMPCCHRAFALTAPSTLNAPPPILFHGGLFPVVQISPQMSPPQKSLLPPSYLLSLPFMFLTAFVTIPDLFKLVELLSVSSHENVSCVKVGTVPVLFETPLRLDDLAHR